MAPDDISPAGLRRRIGEGEADHLLDVLAAGCALVAYADGWVTPEEQRWMTGRIREAGLLPPSRIDALADLFEAVTAQFMQDPEAAEEAALRRMAALRRRPDDAALLVAACAAVAEADGGLGAEERRVLLRICEAVGFEAGLMGFAEAP